MARHARTSPAASTLLLLVAFGLMSAATGLVQKFAMEPMDQNVIMGDKAILPCRVINKRGVLQWTKDSFALGTNRSLDYYPRYTMIGSDEEGESHNST
jgi:hypothetical protein